MLSIRKNKIAQNASWIIGLKLAQMVISFLIGMWTTRFLGPSNYGLISYAQSIVTFVVPIMNLGLTNILVQEFVNEPEKEGETLGTALLMCAVSAVACMIGVNIFATLASPDEHTTIVVCFLYSFLLIAQSLEVIVYWFQAHLISKYSSIVSFAVYVVIALYKLYVLVTGKNIYWFTVSNTMDYFLIGVAELVIYKKLGGKKLKFSWEKAKYMFSKSKYYIISSMMTVIFTHTDRIMIKFMLGSEYNGYYSAAVTCAGLASVVFVAVLDSFRPDIYEKKKSNEILYKESISRLYCIIIYLSLLQCLAMTVFAKLIIHIVCGAQYDPAIPALQIIVWYTTFSYLGAVRNIWILAEDLQRYIWVINLFGALANVVLNYFMIPVWGIEGAAIASLITQIFTNVIVGYIIKPIRPNNHLMVKGLNPKYIISLVKNNICKENN